MKSRSNDRFGFNPNRSLRVESRVSAESCNAMGLAVPRSDFRLVVYFVDIQICSPYEISNGYVLMTDLRLANYNVLMCESLTNELTHSRVNELNPFRF